MWRPRGQRTQEFTPSRPQSGVRGHKLSALTSISDNWSCKGRISNLCQSESLHCMLQLQAQWIKSCHSYVADMWMTIFCVTILIFTKKIYDMMMITWNSDTQPNKGVFLHLENKACISAAQRYFYLYQHITASAIWKLHLLPYCDDCMYLS